jgi:hypothetical protein
VAKAHNGLHNNTKNKRKTTMNTDKITHLKDFKIGAELTTVKINEKGEAFDCKNKLVIAAWCGYRHCWLTASGKAIPKDGKGFYAMQALDTPHFYYSANPEHIEARNERANAERKKRILADEADNRNLELFREDLEELLHRYGASIDAEQLSGDDQGVEVGLSITVGGSSLSI